MNAKSPDSSARQIELHGRTVEYTLRRSRRRTIGLAIDHRGLRVGAPNLARIGEIEALLLKHGQWVLTKLDEWRARPAATPAAIGDGSQWPWLGGTLTLRLQPLTGKRGRAVWSNPAPASEVLTLCLPAATDVAVAFTRALRQRAAELLHARLHSAAQEHALPMPAFALSSARTRWGSCSTRGHIRLNWRLVFFSLPVIDYVIAHELAHLKEMNHSPRFWSEVERLCPDWQARRAELRALSRQLPNL